MTTLAAIQGDGWSVMGCDSRATLDSGRIFDAAAGKIVENNGVLIAAAGSGRGSNLAHYGWKAPKPSPNTSDLDVWITTTFLPKMRVAFINAGYDAKPDGDVASHDSEFLISVRGVIYQVFEDYSWEREARRLYASGSGGDFALAALEALGATKAKTPEKAASIMKKAVEIAIKFDAYSGGEALVISQAV